jgi:hypothetical protein
MSLQESGHDLSDYADNPTGITDVRWEKQAG